MDNSKFDDQEDALYKTFDQLTINFSPCILLIVKVLRCRNVCVSSFQDKYFDTPDPQIGITCSTLAGPKSFKTAVKKNSPTCDINETFLFSIPNNYNKTEAIPVQIDLYDNDLLYNDHLGKKEIDVGDLKPNEIWKRTIEFGKQGEVDLELTKCARTRPDFRYSLSLCDEEKSFRRKRIGFVKEALTKLLGEEKSPKSFEETPIIALVGSGGGYRAIIGMCGAMEAFKDIGILDIFTYACGLSGSSWYLSTAYALRGMKAEEQPSFHLGIRESLKENLYMELGRPGHHAKFKSYKREKRRHDQPCSFVDFFGFCLGKNLLGDQNLAMTMSDMRPYVETGNVPLPLLVSLHVQNTVKASKYHAYLEFSPFEMNMPTHGIGVRPQFVGSEWGAGFLSRICPEPPLHFIQGMCGCAFSILLKPFIEEGGETCEDVAEYIENLRVSVKQKQTTKNQPKDTTELVSDDSEDEFEEKDDTKRLEAQAEHLTQDVLPDQIKVNKPTSSIWMFLIFVWHTAWFKGKHFLNLLYSFNDRRKFSSTLTPNTSKSKSIEIDGLRGEPSRVHKATKGSAPSNTEHSAICRFLKEKLLNSSICKDRDAVVGRTAKIFNVVHGMRDVPTFMMNPLHKKGFIKDCSTEGHQGLEEKCIEEEAGRISTKKKVISVADAGVLKNVPTDIVLRPQRNTELIIVMDFSKYKSDTEFSYEPLLAAAAHATKAGLKFPDINLEDLSEPKEFLAFEGDETGTPTVLWFTLCNRNFKKLKNYKPRFSSGYSSGLSFNDFPVFGKGNKYDTTKFCYTTEEFDRLRDLMYYNVISHRQALKQSIVKAVERKKKKLSMKNGV